MPEDLGGLIDVCVNEVRIKDKIKVTNPSEFLPSDYTEEEWKKLMEEALHREFDPFRNDFENHVRKNLKPEDLGMSVWAKESFIERGIIFYKQKVNFSSRFSLFRRFKNNTK